MSDQDAESPAFGRRSLSVWVVLLSVLVVLLSVLTVAPVFGESGRAAATVSYVLAEAFVLYVGYGALARIVSPAAREIPVST